MDVDLDNDPHATMRDADGMDIDMPTQQSYDDTIPVQDIDMMGDDEDTPMEGDDTYEGEGEGEGEYIEGDEGYYDDEEMHEADDGTEVMDGAGYTVGEAKAETIGAPGTTANGDTNNVVPTATAGAGSSGAQEAGAPSPMAEPVPILPAIDNDAREGVEAAGAATQSQEADETAPAAAAAGSSAAAKHSEDAALQSRPATELSEPAKVAEDQQATALPDPASAEPMNGAQAERPVVAESAKADDEEIEVEEDADTDNTMEDEDLDDLLTVHSLPPVLIHPPSGTPKLLFWTPEDHEVYADIIEAELDILLEGENEKYGVATLDEVLAQIRREMAQKMEVPAGVEAILEERALGLRMGEITLLELLQVHHSCELPLPVHLYLTFEPSRFHDRFEAIRRELVVRAERRKLNGDAAEAEDEQFPPAEGDVRDDEGYESGEDAEAGEDEYDDGEEALDAEGTQITGADGSQTAEEEDGAVNTAQEPAGNDATVGPSDKGAVGEDAVAKQPETTNMDMAVTAIAAGVPLGDVEVNAIQEEGAPISTVIVPDEATAAADEMSEIPDPQVPAPVEDAVIDTAPNPEDTLAPIDEQVDELADDDDDGDGAVPAEDGEAYDGEEGDDYVEGEEGVPEGDEGGEECGDAVEGEGDEYGVEAMTDRAIADQALQEVLDAQAAGELDPPENPLKTALEVGAVGPEAAEEVAGDLVEAGLLDNEEEFTDAVDPQAKAQDDLNPYENYDADEAGDDADGDEYDLEDEGVDAVGAEHEDEDKRSVLSVKRPADDDADEDEGVDLKRPRED